MTLPIYTTEATDALCREISRKSHRCCFLMCSRGKDSLGAWLQCQKYFDRIIPFHCALLPDYQYVTEYLDYLESVFHRKVLRLIGEDLRMSLVRYAYQETPWDCDDIDETFEDEMYNKLVILDYLRMKFNLPRAWCAVGISKNDSIDRLIYCRKNQGKNLKNRTFYPCWDWPREELLNAIMDAGVCLAPEYKYSRRSLGGTPGAAYNKILMEHFPQDWETTKKWYPLAEVKNYREEMIDANYKLWLEQEAAKRGGKTVDVGVGEDGGEEGDGESEGNDGASCEDRGGMGEAVGKDGDEIARRDGVFVVEETDEVNETEKEEE